MITIFNRKEVAATFSEERQAEIRQILGACGVDYRWKIIQAEPNRGRMTERSCFQGKRDSEYVIYVAKRDYEKAMHLLHTYKKQKN